MKGIYLFILLILGASIAYAVPTNQVDPNKDINWSQTINHNLTLGTRNSISINSIMFNSSWWDDISKNTADISTIQGTQDTQATDIDNLQEVSPAAKDHGSHTGNYTWAHGLGDYPLVSVTPRLQNASPTYLTHGANSTYAWIVVIPSSIEYTWELHVP
jgi:hypothetical protein